MADDSVFIQLTEGGRDRDIEIGKIVRMEELGNDKTKIFMTDGKNITVDESIADVRLAIEAAT